MNAAPVDSLGGPVYYFTRVLPHYRQAVLARLNERLGGRLVACAGLPPGKSSLASLASAGPDGFEFVRMRNIWVGGEAAHAQPFRHVFRRLGPAAVVLAEESPRSVTLPWLLRHARRTGAARVLWGHFSSNRRNLSHRSLADRYRILLARSVEACVCYSDAVAEILASHVERPRIFTAPNTLDMDTLSALREGLEKEGRPSVRRRLNLPEAAPVIVFLGRLVRQKGTDMLLRTFGLLRQRCQAQLVVMGSGPEQQAMRRHVANAGMDGVRFLGSVPDWQGSAPYLYAADVLLNPGYLGLSINHAFAFGLPVVSQLPPKAGIRFHSPEIAYLIPGENGELAAPADPEALANAVELVLARRESYARNALRYAREHLTLDRMVDGLEAAIRFAAGNLRS